jgi:formylglycine-generating enzyme required for sulfatase activity
LQGYANIYDAYARDHVSEIPDDTTKWPWKPTKDVNDGFATTAPVKTFSANAFGLYDMHGNVWEWCSDRYGDYPSESATDPTGPTAAPFRVVRGGSWFNPAGWARSAVRYGKVPDERTSRTGFRPARSVGQ